jgi:Cys-rich four helix bundle protein (predicted Tat secretion target)
MDRREMLGGVGVLAMAAVAGQAMAADHNHDHHHGAKNQALIDGASDCIKTGEACINHCLDLLAQGDKELAACAKSVNELLAVCAALQRLATVDSKFLPKYAKVSADFCEACEMECRKHEKKHAECKACAESCAACLKECRKIAS